MNLFEEKIGAQRCALFWVDRPRQQLWATVVSGDVREIRIPLKSGYLMPTLLPLLCCAAPHCRDTCAPLTAAACCDMRLICSLAGYVACSGNTVNIEDAYQDPRFNKWDIAMRCCPVTSDEMCHVIREVDRRSGFRTRSVLAMPIMDSHEEVCFSLSVRLVLCDDAIGPGCLHDGQQHVTTSDV